MTRVWRIARWSVSAAAAAGALVTLNHGLYSTWQATAPPGNEYAAVWAHEARLSIGYAVAFSAVAIIAAVILRPGWPHLKSKRTLVILIAGILGLLYPRAQHFLAVDACLDRGGRWDYRHEVCEPRPAPDERNAPIYNGRGETQP